MYETAKGSAEVAMLGKGPATHHASHSTEPVEQGAIDRIMSLIGALHDVQNEALNTTEVIAARLFGPTATGGPLGGPSGQPGIGLLEATAALDAALAKACAIRDAAYGINRRL